MKFSVLTIEALLKLETFIRFPIRASLSNDQTLWRIIQLWSALLGSNIFSDPYKTLPVVVFSQFGRIWFSFPSPGILWFIDWSMVHTSCAPIGETRLNPTFTLLSTADCLNCASLLSYNLTAPFSITFKFLWEPQSFSC